MTNYHWEAIEELESCGAPYFSLKVGNRKNCSQLVCGGTLQVSVSGSTFHAPRCSYLILFSMLAAGNTRSVHSENKLARGARVHPDGVLKRPISVACSVPATRELG